MDPPSFETTISAQADVTRRINSFVTNYGKTSRERFSLGYLSARANGINVLWDEFTNNHRLIVASANAEELSTHDYFKADRFAQFEEVYFEIAGRIAEKQFEMSAPRNAASNAASNNAPIAAAGQIQPANNQPAHHIQVPRLNVPSFSGNYEEWQSFHDLFVAAVHSNDSLRPAQKLQYLKSLVKGAAETTIKYTPITDANYATAWQALQDRFANKRAIVNTHIRKLLTQRNADETSTSIRCLIDTTKDCINALKTQEIDISTWDAMLVYVVAQYVPKNSLNLWEQSLTGTGIPSFEDMLKFLETRFRALEFSPNVITNNSRARPSNNQSFHAAPSLCRVCQNAPHPLRLCPKFADMSSSQRLNHIKKSNLCKNCFAFSHSTQECKSPGRCNACNQKHHSMLHLNNANANTSDAGTVAQSTAAAQPAVSAAPSMTLMSRPNDPATGDSILATALVTITSFNGRVHTFRALLDNGSQDNFVTKRLVQFLGLKPRHTSLVFSGLGQAEAPRPIGQVQFSFGSKYDATLSMNVNAVVFPEITHNLPSKQLTVPKELVEDLELADPSYGTPSTIDMLLSASTFAALTLPSIKKQSATIALQTRLGWVLYGEAATTDVQQTKSCFHVMVEDPVSAALQKFWQLEEIAVEKTQSADDVLCEQIYAQTHRRNADGRYCVTLPFKNTPALGPSRDRAVTRFMQIERKLLRDDKLRAEYSKCIHEYLTLGHMHRIDTTEEQHRVSLPNGQIIHQAYYLPHHAVVKTDSTTTKLRVVFDASSKTVYGPSLNETLLVGPVIQDTLFNLLLRWRTYCVVIKADIEKMYRQIMVDEKHQPYQRILWRDSPHEAIQDYQLRTVTFGTAAAPYLAIKTLHQLATDEMQQHPIGSRTIKHDFYVDDLLSGADTVDTAIEKQQQVISVLQSGGFQIRKWSSNHHQVTEHMDDAAKELCSDSASTLKTLGIMWSPKFDKLSIKVTSTPSPVTTKRQLLSEVSKLFDPLGWIAPAIIKIKILMQKLWLAGLEWDEPLPSPIMNGWIEFQTQLPSIELIRIDRWIRTLPQNPIEIHGFSDASEKAYAAAVYVRVKINDRNWAIHLIAAKTRVAPVKQITVPRLELCAAALLAKLLVSIAPSFDKAPMFAWTDSEIVLAWLQGHPHKWTTFVGNRIAQIHETVDATAWRHVPTKDNPADCASRGISPNELLYHPLWWHGPPWLAKDADNWPKKQRKEINDTTMEMRKVQVFLIAPENDTLTQILDKYTPLSKAVRIVVYLRRWRTRHKSPALAVAELTHARNVLIKHVQQLHFYDEFVNLSKKLPICNKSKLLTLNPFIDEENMIRVGGRLHHADLPFHVKHPLIMPKSSRLTELIIAEAHAQTLHGGVALTLAHLRNIYWILDGRRVVRQYIHKCNNCHKFTNPCLNQLMGNLPKPRVTMSNPFQHTGLDYAGPVAIRMRRGPGKPITFKGYICLFVCLATKAIHLELVGDMSTATFLAAFNRFTSRRGLPSDMYSDNGTYFVRAAHDIDCDMEKIIKSNCQEAGKIASQTATQWHFIPPAAPHFGGLWEAGIKSTKYHLKRHLGDGHLTYEEMATVLCQIESCLNSRPLCPISNDPNDFEILTPGHFLVGRPLLARPQPSVLEIPPNRLEQWQRIYQTTERFWSQWRNEYLSRLQQRPKWLAEQVNMQKGELVLIKDDDAPPTQWRLARIIDTHPGADGLTRVVTVRTPTTTLKRPIVKLCKIPTQ